MGIDGMQVTDWLEVDYSDPDRPPAMPAPDDWDDDDDPAATAQEAFGVQTATGSLLAARRGLSTIYLGAELIRADFDTEADAHADYARIRAEISGDPRHQLQAAGAWLAACRAETRKAMDWLGDVVPGAVRAGVPEAHAARLAGVDRMTVRRLLGKRS